MVLSLPLLVSPSVERAGKQRNTSEQNKDIQDVICHGIQLLLFCANLLTSSVRICVLFPFLLDCSPCNWLYKKQYRLTNELLKIFDFHFFLPSLTLVRFLYVSLLLHNIVLQIQYFFNLHANQLILKKRSMEWSIFWSCSRCACVLYVCVCVCVSA